MFNLLWVEIIPRSIAVAPIAVAICPRLGHAFHQRRIWIHAEVNTGVLAAAAETEADNVAPVQALLHRSTGAEPHKREPHALAVPILGKEVKLAVAHSQHPKAQLCTVAADLPLYPVRPEVARHGGIWVAAQRASELVERDGDGRSARDKHRLLTAVNAKPRRWEGLHIGGDVQRHQPDIG